MAVGVCGCAMMALVACASAPRAGDAAQVERRAVVIDSVVPSRGVAGVAYPLELTLFGRGFADSANTVLFGVDTVAGVRATAGGTRVVFFAPKERRSAGEVPPMVLPPGAYSIRVRTDAGESNAVRFILVPERDAP